VRTSTLLIALVLCGMFHGTAVAQTSLIASLGKLYGGDVQTSSKTWGIALGGSGAHSIGSELEFSQTSKMTDVLGNESKVLSLMASVMVAGHAGPVRPYGLFGYGFIRQRTESSTGFVLSNLSNNDVGYNVGAGVTYKFSKGAGVRVDLRHFKVRKADGLSFQRLMVGIVLGG
jgi:opacity protein-like surface antigen